MKNKKRQADEAMMFWTLSKRFISHQLPEIRKASLNTVKAYRDSLNNLIDYLEAEKHVSREYMAFSDFSHTNITDYLDWLLNEKKYAEKTCNRSTYCYQTYYQIYKFAGHYERIYHE